MTGPTAPRSPLSLIELVQARLEMQKDEIGLAHVYGLLDFTDARKRLHTPAAGVMVIAEDFSENLEQDIDEAVVQRDTATLAVIVMVSAANDPGGSKGETEDELTPLVAGTRRALLGWAPEGEFIGRADVHTDETFRRLTPLSRYAPAVEPAARWRPLMLRRGRLAAIGDGTGRAWWQDDYTTHRLIYGAPSELDCPAPPTELCVSTQGEDPVPLEEAS